MAMHFQNNLQGFSKLCSAVLFFLYSNLSDFFPKSELADVKERKREP